MPATVRPGNMRSSVAISIARYAGLRTTDARTPTPTVIRPVAASTAAVPAPATADIQLRAEAAHDEVFIRLARKDMSWPAMLPAVDALHAWLREQQREPAGALRQVLIADQRTAAPDAPVCDLSVPLR